MSNRLSRLSELKNMSSHTEPPPYKEPFDWKGKAKRVGKKVLRVLKMFVPWKDKTLPLNIVCGACWVSVIALIIICNTTLVEVNLEKEQLNVVAKQVSEIHSKGKENGAAEIPAKTVVSVKEKEPLIMDEFVELYAKNSRIVGWITVGEDIDHPVLQTEDNSYYLHRNFYDEEVKSGSIFADYRNQFKPKYISDNTILYGHNIWTGIMFSKLTRYYDGTLDGGKDPLSYYKKNPTIEFDTIYENSKWKVFACCLFNTSSTESFGEVYPFNAITEFESEEEFNDFIIDIMDRSVIWTDVDLQYGDKLLTLSTCYYPYTKEKADTRCVVFARKVRPGESTEVNTDAAVRNPKPYTIQGKGEKGHWDKSKLLSYKATEAASSNAQDAYADIPDLLIEEPPTE